MVRGGLTGPALLGLAGDSGADEAVGGVVYGVLRFDLLAGGVFLGGVLGVALLELKLGFALAALDEVAHFADGLELHVLELLWADESLDLVLHHLEGAAILEALEVAALVGELSVNVFIDAGHAEDVPAVVYVEQHVPVEVLVVLTLAMPALHDLRRVHCQVCLYLLLLHRAPATLYLAPNYLHHALACLVVPTFATVQLQDISQGSCPTQLMGALATAEGLQLVERHF